MRKFYTFIALILFSLPVFSDPIRQVCLENDAVHRYLTEVEYDPNDYSYSKIMDYCDSYPWNWKNLGGYRKDHPLPVGIKLEAPIDTISTLYVSEDVNFANAWTYTIAKDTDSIDVYNLIPGRTYYYKVVYPKPDHSLVRADSSVFKTTGTLRMLKIDGIYNVRDLGGWIGLGGHPIKYGKIIRGSRLNINNSSTKIITPEGIAELRKIGIRAELDMRNRSNAANATTSFLGSDIPIYNVENAYNSRIATFADAPQSIEGINKLIQWMKQGRAVYLHCSVGADRTGTVAFLVEALCGLSEDALCKEFELTSFSGDWIENERDPGNSERLIRQRNYTGRLDPNDNNESYKFAKMMDKVKSFSGNSIQRKVYNHLKSGVNGQTVKEDDMIWLINELVDYVIVKTINTDGGNTLNLVPKQTHALNAVVVPDTATNKALTFKSSDTLVAKVSSDGVITAVGGGTASISIQADDYVKTVTVKVPLVESFVSIPDTVYYADNVYVPKSTVTNLIKNGSFEYGHHFLNWTGANEKELSSAAFEYKEYEQGDSVYLQSKADGDSISFKSLRTMWKIEKGKSYVFGYRVKNSTNKVSEKNQNLATSLVSFSPSLEASGDNFSWDTSSPAPMRTELRGEEIDSLTFEFPTYGGEWTEVRYAFTNTDHQYIQVWFTHLSDGVNNTCFDNFYLCELTDITSVSQIKQSNTYSDKIYNLAGQEVVNPGKGIYIKNGKKYIVR